MCDYCVMSDEIICFYPARTESLPLTKENLLFVESQFVSFEAEEVVR